MVIHSNHPQEINIEVGNAMDRLSTFTLLNQAVLLKNINDSEAVLTELSHKLFSIGVLPYYLHQLDRVQGAAHFLVDDERAKEIHSALKKQLPGYLVPKLSRETPGEVSKTILQG